MSANTAPPATEENNGLLPDLHLEELKNIDKDAIVSRLGQFEDLLITLSIDWGVRLLAAILILIIGWSIGSWVYGRFQRAHRLDTTLKDFLGRVVKYTIITVAAVTVVGLFGIPMASLLAVLGAAGLAIGLALQGTLSNIASGVMLLILRPFNVGDYITWGGQGGTVKSLGLFGTEFAMADNVYLFAPNSKIWGTEIINYSRNMLRRQDIVVSINYDDNLDEALKILGSIVQAEERILKDDGKMPQILTDKLNDFTIDVIVRFWSQNADYWNLRWDLTKAIKEQLESAGFSLPLTPRQLAVMDSRYLQPTT